MRTLRTLVSISLWRLAFGALFSLLAFTLTAQTTVTGKVTAADDGLGLPGATVLLKGTLTGTVTDFDGNYEIQVPSAESVLVFSFTGMTEQEITVGSRSVIDVVMESSMVSLDEVVVTGYGVQKKVNLSGAVDQVDIKQLESRPISNIAQGLQGASPNLNIDFNSGEPGQAAKINIRGLTSINGGEPLILIDGVPSDALELNRLAPEDVESISVLKDASSAAIYGARAAFGVILITTKTGTQDGVTVNYTTNFSTGTPTVLPNKVTDPYIYLRVRETSTDNTPWDNQNYSDERYAWARERSDNPAGTTGVRINPNDATSWEYMGDRDWTFYFLDNYTTSQNHNLNINGRSNSTQYYLSGSFNRQTGALQLADDLFDRYSLRGKVNFQVNDWISVGNNTYLTSTTRDNPTYFDMWTLYNFHPTDWDKNPDGSWANTDVGRMGAQLVDGGTEQNKYNSFQSNFTAQFNLIGEMWKVNADYTVRRGTGNYEAFATKYQVGFGPEDIREEGNNWARRSNTTDTYNVFNVYTTFNQRFGDRHEVTAIAGYNQEYFRTEWFTAYRDGVISASLPTIALATGDAQVNEYIADWAVRGIFGRLNYTFNDKYIIEFNGRYDGSSKFPSADRYGFFPSASVGWRLDKEPFLAGLTNQVSLLKLRGSYGTLGNQFVTEYGYIPTMNASLANYIIDGERPQRVTPPSLVSSNYTWENVSTLNFGVDVGLFEDRLVANFDVFRRQTTGMLTLGKDLPDVLGAAEPLENAADLETKGWELSLSYRNSVPLAGKRLSFDTRFVISDSRSTITGFDNPNQNLTQYYVGQELGEIWGLESDGLFQSESEIEGLDQSSLIPWGALSIVPGWPKYVDQDGNGAIETGLTVSDPKDLRVIGNVTPRYRYGFNLNMNWNGFDVSAFFQGIGQRDYYPLDYLYWGFYQQPYAGGYNHLLDFYRGEADSPTERAKHSQAYLDAGLADANTDAEYPVLQAWLADRNLGERVDQAKGLAIPQTRYLLSAAYLRFKNLTVGYTLPANLTQKINIAQVRLFVSGENIAEWSAISDFFDPEAISDIDVKINPGVNPSRTAGKGYAYPFQRRYSVGLNVMF